MAMFHHTRHTSQIATVNESTIDEADLVSKEFKNSICAFYMRNKER